LCCSWWQVDVIAGGDYMRVAELVSALEEASFS